MDEKPKTQEATAEELRQVLRELLELRPTVLGDISAARRFAAVLKRARGLLDEPKSV